MLWKCGDWIILFNISSTCSINLLRYVWVYCFGHHGRAGEERTAICTSAACQQIYHIQNVGFIAHWNFFTILLVIISFMFHVIAVKYTRTRRSQSQSNDWAVSWMTGIRFPPGRRNFSLQSIHTSAVVQPASCSAGTRGRAGMLTTCVHILIRNLQFHMSLCDVQGQLQLLPYSANFL